MSIVLQNEEKKIAPGSIPRDGYHIRAESFVRHGAGSHTLNNETIEFLTDTLHLFTGTQQGHMGRWLYSDCRSPKDEVRGSRLWSEFVANSLSFYMHNADLVMLNSALEDLRNHIPSRISLIDFGPGSEDAFKIKSLSLIKKIKPEAYYPVDICRDFLSNSTKSILREKRQKQINWHIKIEPIHADFFKPLRLIETNIERPSLIFFGGGTVANLPFIAEDDVFPKEQYVNYFKQLHSLSHGQTYLFLSFDTNQDNDSILESYSDNAYAAWVQNLTYRMKRDLPIHPLEGSGFKPGAFHYEPKWHPKRNLLAHTLVVTKDQTFNIAATPAELKVGDRLFINNSYKIPADLMRNIAVEAMWDPIAEYPVSEGKYVGMLLKKRCVNNYTV